MTIVVEKNKIVAVENGFSKAGTPEMKDGTYQ